MHQIEIVNLALTRLGLTSVTSLGEASAEASAAAKVWDAAVRAALQEHRWGFNTKRAALPLRMENPAGSTFLFRYGAPADLLQPYEIFQADVTQDRPIPFLFEGGDIYSDEAGAILIYGANAESAVSFSSQFCDALAWRLASELAAPLTQKTSLMEYAMGRYQDSVARAKASAGNAQRPRDEKIPSYIRARG